MKKLFLLLLAFVSANAFADITISIENGAKTTFYVGEKIFVSVYIQETNALLDASGDGQQGVDGYEIVNTSTNASWLRQEGRPEKADGTVLHTTEPDNHWQNNQVFWIQLSGTTLQTGTYSGTIVVKRKNEANVVEYSNPVGYSFVVEDYPMKTPVVISYDSAASYGRQIDFHSYIRNNGDSRRILKRPYMDYYMTKSSDRQAFLNVWEKPTQSCVQILDCGNGHMVFRQKFLQDLDLASGEISEEFLLGYNELSTPSNAYLFDPLPEKDIAAFGGNGYNATSLTNEYLDFSYAGYATNYAARAMRRNRFYNPTVAIYENGGSWVSGNIPAWFNEASCREINPTTAKRLDYTQVRTDNLGSFCKDDDYFKFNFPEGDDVIYEGEDYFLRLDVQSDYEVTYSLGDGSYEWFEIGSAADYWDDYKHVEENNVNTKRYHDIIYVRSKHNHIRQRSTLYPEAITYTIDVSDSHGHKTSRQRTIVIKDGREHPNAHSGLAVLLGDETWFKKYQLDIATGIVNYSEKSIELENFYYDYYGEIDYKSVSSEINQPHFWYPKLEDANGLNISETFTDCGNNRFRVRYKYNGKKTIRYNSSIFDNKVGFYYETFRTYHKYDDFSMEPFENDTLKRRRYAPKMPLYNGNDSKNPLWGEAPEWAHDCEDGSGGGSGDITDNPPIDPPIESSSSSSEIVDNLEVRFADVATYTDTRLDMKLDVVNKGTEEVDLGNYEIRFYFNKTSLLNDIDLLNKTPMNTSGVSVQEKRCAEGLYMLSMKFNTDIHLAAGSSTSSIDYSMVYPKGTDAWHGAPFGKNEFASYLANSDLAPNNNIALFDGNGNLVFGIPAWECEGYTQKTLKLSVLETLSLTKDKKHEGKVGNVTLIIKNDGDSVVTGPVYVDYQVTHSLGQVPVIAFEDDTLTVANRVITTSDGLRVVRQSSGNKHVFRFILDEGIKEKDGNKNDIEISFTLFDQCLYDCTGETEDEDLIQSWEKQYSWDFTDDWSAKDVISYEGDKVKYPKKELTNNVTIYNSDLTLIYGLPDPSSPVIAYPLVEEKKDAKLMHAFVPNEPQHPNRTDAVAYSGGQLLSGGDFETPWLQGWNVSGDVKSIRGNAPQGSRYIELQAGSRISQSLSPAIKQILADSGATIIVWHKGAYTQLYLNEQSFHQKPLPYSANWKLDTIPIPASFWTNDVNTISVRVNDTLSLDDMVMIPGSRTFPSTYAVRFTTTQHEEIETRAFDGEKELLVTNSIRDILGRSWKKFLPFALPCSNVQECNSETKTLRNPEMANRFYTAARSDYPDAKKYAFAETKWKPDQLATTNAFGAPGPEYSLDNSHVVRSYSSGINLDQNTLLDFAKLAEAVKAVPNIVPPYIVDKTQLQKNYHAAKDGNPTHVWLLNVDQNNNAAFSVADGNGNIVVSGAMAYDLSTNTYNMISRSVNELDSRGNVIKAHPPMSCEYSEYANDNTNCVYASEYDYDDQSRVIRSWEPDLKGANASIKQGMGMSVVYYDLNGRIRATQTQNQINAKTASAIVYDQLNRVIATGEWKHGKEEDELRIALLSDERDEANKGNFPSEKDLTPGTITRTFYDYMPTPDTLSFLSVKLSPAGSTFKHTRGRVTAVVSDVQAVFDEDGLAVKATNGSDSVIRVSSANSYDKYGRILTSYSYDPTMPADSLKTLVVETQYDIGGKVIETTKFPYGYGTWDHARAIKERYVYDRLGRIDSILSKSNGSPEILLAHYEYYPTGGVKTVNMGNTLNISYTYHISGALKTAIIKTKNGGELYSEELHYEDCGGSDCVPQYNGNISYMAQRIAHDNRNFVQNREVAYYYDQLNRLIKTDDQSQEYFDEIFDYDVQGRITGQRRANMAREGSSSDGKYTYENGSNRLLSVADGIGGTANGREMSASDNFVYDSEGNLIEDKSKRLKISYDWRGMPIEFTQYPPQENTGVSGDTLFRLTVAYDGSGRRISKTRWVKARGDAGWSRELVTHYTGIGTEVRENLAASEPVTQVVVNMPQGLGRYGIESAGNPATGAKSFEWYLKNHLGSTMLVYGTGAGTPGGLLAAYDYRSFGEQVTLTSPSTGKVTENFTGKERDDETQLDYFGARYLDPMLGMWISVDPMRQFASPYLYAGNGVNPINGVDGDGNELDELGMELYDIFAEEDFFGSSVLKEDWDEMKNSYLTYHFVFSDEDYAWNIDRTNTICLPSSKNTGETKQLQELAVLGRHEYDHLKGIPKTAWHDIPEHHWRTNDYFEVMKKNNTLLEGMKRGHNVEKGYDRIYGRDYKAYQQMGRDDK